MTTQTSKLPIVWYKGCQTQEEKTNRELLVRNSAQFASLFLSILADKAEMVERKGLKEEEYTDTNWMISQVFRNGKLSQLTELAELFNFLKGQ